MKGKLIWLIFWLLVVDFMVCGLGFIPAVARLMRGAGFALVFALFILLGIALIVLTVRGKVAGLLGKSLILTGAAPVAFVIKNGGRGRIRTCDIQLRRLVPYPD